MPIHEEAFADRIYEAAVLPEFWPQVLRDFAEAAESREAVLVSATADSFKWVCSSPAAEYLAQEVYKYPAGAARSRWLIAQQRAGFATEPDMLTDAEMFSEPMYAEFLIPRGYGRGLATAIQLPDGHSIIIHAEGDYKSGPVTPALFARVDAFRPHLARSALISARLAFERARTAVETLAGLGLAACALADSGVVLVENEEFSKERTLWTTRGQDRIALYDKRADRMLYEALGAIGSERGVRSIALCAEETGAPAVLHLVPVRRSAHDLFGQAVAIMVLTKPVDSPTGATPLLQALFDLTVTEAGIAARIAAGQTADEIATRDAKSVGTVRDQLKSVLEKTGCRRQVDLARLLARLIPPAA